MATQEFSKLYYRTSNCLTSDIIADFAPVSRILGVDTSTGMGAVFTAMGYPFLTCSMWRRKLLWRRMDMSQIRGV